MLISSLSVFLISSEANSVDPRQLEVDDLEAQALKWQWQSSSRDISYARDCRSL